MAQRIVHTIPATVNRFTASPIMQKSKRKVAGYARVSTDMEEQLTSYDAQVKYYTDYIKNHDDWEFVGMYADEGITGTSIKHREGFKRMIADALAGKIDLIITKSVSRFARNTVDSLTTIRKLKETGTECYFEKENIWTFDGKGELLLTIMSSIAQEEARSISENCTWGQRKRFADGKVSFPYSSVLGFDRGTDGEIVINYEQAKTVKSIFKMFLEGMTPHSIAVNLTKQGIKSPTGKDKWNQGTVRRMLSNEKYKGDALLQKEFTVDFLMKKQKKNEGEIPQYYIEGNHEAIISPEIFDLVQAELERRKRNKGGRYSGVNMFSSKIKCGCCGSWYGSKVWHSNDKYRRVIYQCNHKFNDTEKCTTPHITEEKIKEVFITAFNQLIIEKNEIIANIELVQKTLFDTSSIIIEKNKTAEEIVAVAEMTQSCVTKNARIVQNQDEYQMHYDELVKQYDKLKERFDELNYEIEQKQAQNEKMRIFINTLRSQNTILNEFDGGLWSSLVEFVRVDDTEFTVFFKDGTEIKV